jgi:hypothetical protein
MAKSEEKVIFINDVELKESDMTDKQKYFTQQVQDLTNKQTRLQFELDQVNASLNVFKQALIETTKEVANETLKEKDEANS